MPTVVLVVDFGTRKHNVPGIGNDDKVPTVNVGQISRFMFAG